MGYVKGIYAKPQRTTGFLKAVRSLVHEVVKEAGGELANTKLGG
jgi:hypothetical protein